MLKVKDNIDLKELEKYGFEYDELFNEYTKYLDTRSLDIDEIIIREDRIVYNYTLLETYDGAYGGDYELKNAQKNKIKDLIKADLIEKVGE